MINYRLVRKTNKLDNEDEHVYGIHEVVIDNEGKISHIDPQAASIYSYSVARCANMYRDMFQAIQSPVICFETRREIIIWVE